MNRPQDPRHSEEPTSSGDSNSTGHNYDWTQEGHTAELHINPDDLGPAPRPRQEFPSAPHNYQSAPEPQYAQAPPQPLAPPQQMVVPASAPPKSSSSGVITIIALLVLALLAVGAAFFAYTAGIFGGDESDPEPSVVVVTEYETEEVEQAPEAEDPEPAPEPPAEPAQEQPQPEQQGAPNPTQFTRYNAANDATSPEFALSVFDAFVREYQVEQRTDITVVAISPESGVAYEMQCGGEQPVSCQGGNGAKVDIW